MNSSQLTHGKEIKFKELNFSENSFVDPATTIRLIEQGWQMTITQPIEFSASLAKLVALLELHFESCVEAKVVLSNQEESSFVEAESDSFILQLSGNSQWSIQQGVKTQQ